MSEQASVRRGVSYHRRKELGQARRAEFLRRLNHAEHVATVFWGLALGGFYVAVMGFVARVDTVLEVIVMIIALTVAFWGVWIAGYIVEREYRRRRY
jgi:hypothetical protein